MTHVVHIMEVIGDDILPLTSSMKFENYDTYKWKLQEVIST